jgi:hypothetical protein
MLLAKPISTSMSASTTLCCFEGSTITDPTLYRSIGGSLQYLSITRPNIAFAVNKVSQFMQDPKDSHWSAAKAHQALPEVHNFTYVQHLQELFQATYCLLRFRLG